MFPPLSRCSGAGSHHNGIHSQPGSILNTSALLSSGNQNKEEVIPPQLCRVVLMTSPPGPDREVIIEWHGCRSWGACRILVKSCSMLLACILRRAGRFLIKTVMMIPIKPHYLITPSRVGVLCEFVFCVAGHFVVVMTGPIYSFIL